MLDDRKRSDTVKPLQPRQLVADDTTNTVYITGIGKESVIWVVDGATLKLKDTITNTGTFSTGLALDAKAKRLYTTNADGELVTIDTATNKILSRKKVQDDGKEHFYLNLSLGHCRPPCVRDGFKTARSAGGESERWQRDAENRRARIAGRTV